MEPVPQPGTGETRVVPRGSLRLALFSPVREQGGKFLAGIIGPSKDAVLEDAVLAKLL